MPRLLSQQPHCWEGGLRSGVFCHVPNFILFTLVRHSQGSVEDEGPQLQ